jgi:hypothetical protein
MMIICINKYLSKRNTGLYIKHIKEKLNKGIFYIISKPHCVFRYILQLLVYMLYEPG